MLAAGGELGEGLGDFVFDGRYGRDHSHLSAPLSWAAYAPRRGPAWLDSSARSYRNMREFAAAAGRPPNCSRTCTGCARRTSGWVWWTRPLPR